MRRRLFKSEISLIFRPFQKVEQETTKMRQTTLQDQQLNTWSEWNHNINIYANFFFYAERT